MAIPDFETLTKPMLNYASDKQEHSYRDTIEFLANEYNLSEDERKFAGQVSNPKTKRRDLSIQVNGCGPMTKIVLVALLMSLMAVTVVGSPAVFAWDLHVDLSTSNFGDDRVCASLLRERREGCGQCGTGGR